MQKKIFSHSKICIINTYAYFTGNFCINLIGPHQDDICVRNGDQFLSEWDLFNSLTQSTVDWTLSVQGILSV
jgi:hypothetical protein